MLLVKRSLFAHGTQVILIALYRFELSFQKKCKIYAKQTRQAEPQN